MNISNLFSQSLKYKNIESIKDSIIDAKFILLSIDSTGGSIVFTIKNNTEESILIDTNIYNNKKKIVIGHVNYSMIKEVKLSEIKSNEVYKIKIPIYSDSNYKKLVMNFGFKSILEIKNREDKITYTYFNPNNTCLFEIDLTSFKCELLCAEKALPDNIVY